MSEPISVEQAQSLWTLHDLLGHVGGARPEYDPDTNQLIGWVPACSCSWKLGAYTAIEDPSDSIEQRRIFTEFLGDWLGHFTLHITDDALFDHLFPEAPNAEVTVTPQFQADLSIVVTRPQVQRSIAWSG